MKISVLLTVVNKGYLEIKIGQKLNSHYVSIWNSNILFLL